MNLPNKEEGTGRGEIKRRKETLRTNMAPKITRITTSQGMTITEAHVNNLKGKESEDLREWLEEVTGSEEHVESARMKAGIIIEINMSLDTRKTKWRTEMRNIIAGIKAGIGLMVRDESLLKPVNIQEIILKKMAWSQPKRRVKSMSNVSFVVKTLFTMQSVDVLILQLAAGIASCDRGLNYSRRPAPIVKK